MNEPNVLWCETNNEEWSEETTQEEKNRRFTLSHGLKLRSGRRELSVIIISAILLLEFGLTDQNLG